LGSSFFFIFFLPHLSLGEERPRSKWGLGLAAGWINDYPGAAQGRMRFLPFPVYRGESVRLDRISGVTGDVYNDSRWDFTWNFIFQFPTDSELIPVRQGMPDLDTLLSLGPQLNYTIFRSLSQHFFFRFPLRLNSCTNFSDRMEFCGVVFNPGVRHMMLFEKWGELTLRAELLANSSEYQQYFYQVDPEFVTPTRSAFHARAGFLGFIYGFFHTYPFDGWELSTTVNIYDYSLAINRDSPLFLHKTNFAVFLAVVVDIGD
jgi:outer membrane protein